MEPHEVIEFWFGEDLNSPEAVSARTATWFGGDAEFDREIHERFHTLPDRAVDPQGECAAWRESARSSLALVIALDQFPRNLFRGSAKAFAYDEVALDVAEWAISRGFDRELHPVECTFLYLPLEHAENLERQERSVALFRSLAERAPADLAAQFESYLDYAVRHHAVIAEFGRFPHRNAPLGRPETAAERAYLEGDGDRF